LTATTAAIASIVVPRRRSEQRSTRRRSKRSAARAGRDRQHDVRDHPHRAEETDGRRAPGVAVDHHEDRDDVEPVADPADELAEEQLRKRPVREQAAIDAKGLHGSSARGAARRFRRRAGRGHRSGEFTPRYRGFARWLGPPQRARSAVTRPYASSIRLRGRRPVATAALDRVDHPLHDARLVDLLVREEEQVATRREGHDDRLVPPIAAGDRGRLEIVGHDHAAPAELSAEDAVDARLREGRRSIGIELAVHDVAGHHEVCQARPRSAVGRAPAPAVSRSS
jgi:hypothetical protein